VRHEDIDNTLPRLVALKNKYDPANVFRRNSNVDPTQAQPPPLPR
jgi:FAD/FMN-containing dehydrogenase